MLKTFHFENLTPEEAYRLNGTLEKRHIEELLDRVGHLDVESAASELEEARGSLPGEDFLDGLYNQINALIEQKGGRVKDFKDDLKEILEKVDTLGTQIRQDVEYTKEKMDSCLKSLNS